MYRRYAQEPLDGSLINHRKRSELRKYFGRKVEYLKGGWHLKRTGVLQDASGHNILISGNWEWGPDIERMHVLEEV